MKISRINVLIVFLFCFVVNLIAQQKPNILFILVDDMGYSDISCFGSEIPTPHIDNLAENGIRFNRCYVSPMCVTSRVALMSGMEFMAAGQGGFSKGISFAHLLRDAGYTTSLVGKNHGMSGLKIGTAKDYGFDHFYGFEGGQINSFTGAGNVTWQNDGQTFPNTNLPNDFYSTKDFTDYAIKYIGEAIDDEKPFFTFLAFNAPHTPLDAPEKNVRKFYDPVKGINAFEKGWQKLREERLQRMKQLGIIGSDVELSEAGVEIPDWDLLPNTSEYEWELQKQFECLSRSAFAGMVDNIDENVGRIVSYLKDPNNDGDQSDSQLDNTIIIFMSDNGGCYAGLHTNRSALPWSQVNRGQGFCNNYGWGTLSNTPFRYYKHASHEGAIRSPLVIHWPDGLEHEKGSIIGDMVSIWDFYPTFLEIAGTTYPNQSGKKPLMGKSMLPLLKGESFEAERYFVSVFQSRSRGIVKDNWKLVNYFDGPFELYDLDKDPAETDNLAQNQPEVVTQLTTEWDNYAQTHGFANNKTWNPTIGDEIRGWGYDRIRTGLIKSVPDYMSENVDINTKLTLTFSGKLSFANTIGKYIRLQKYGVPGFIWSADPSTASQYEGKTFITFDDFPKLDPDSHYNITWDSGWVKYDKAGKWVSIPSVRESAYAYRFKTVSTVDAQKIKSRDDKVMIYQDDQDKVLHIHTAADLENAKAEIYNLEGKKITQSRMDDQYISIDTNGWSKGIYIANIINETGSQSQKFLIQ